VTGALTRPVTRLSTRHMTIPETLFYNGDKVDAMQLAINVFLVAILANQNVGNLELHYTDTQTYLAQFQTAKPVLALLSMLTKNLQHLEVVTPLPQISPWPAGSLEAELLTVLKRFDDALGNKGILYSYLLSKFPSVDGYGLLNYVKKGLVRHGLLVEEKKGFLGLSRETVLPPSTRDLLHDDKVQPVLRLLTEFQKTQPELYAAIHDSSVTALRNV
jgi:hypothetical protein